MLAGARDAVGAAVGADVAGASVRVAIGCGECGVAVRAAWTGCAVGGAGLAAGVALGAAVVCTIVCVDRPRPAKCAIAMPKNQPPTTTATAASKVINHPLPPLDGRRVPPVSFSRLRRPRSSPLTRRSLSPAAGGSSKSREHLRVTVRVPLDIHAVAASGCSAFALATPLRISDVISLAVREAIGVRAPHDKYIRSVRATLKGFDLGRFTIDVDGRRFNDPSDVVVCAGTAQVRFFLPARRATRPELAAPER